MSCRRALPLVIRSGVDSLTSGFRLSAGVRIRRASGALGRQRDFQYWMRVILIGISRDIEYDLRNDCSRTW